MSLFGSIGISGSGLDAAQSWINTSAANIANANDVSATSGTVYGTETPVLTPQGSLGQVGDGVAVAGIQVTGTNGMIEQDPTSPLADRQGNVRRSAVDVGTQMVQLVQAQESYSANATAMERALTAYRSALTLGS